MRRRGKGTHRSPQVDQRWVAVGHAGTCIRGLLGVSALREGNVGEVRSSKPLMMKSSRVAAVREWSRRVGRGWVAGRLESDAKHFDGERS